MPLSLYIRRASFVHHLHPLTKVAFLAATFAAGLAVTHPLSMAVLVAYVAIAAFLARALPAFRATWPLLVLLFALTALIWIWAYPDGGPPIRIGPLSLPSRGALFGLAMGSRLAVFLAAGLVFLATTRIEAFAAALRRLGLPYTAGFVLTLAFRLVPVFVETALIVAQAHRARGYEMDRGPIWIRLRRRSRLIVPIFLSGLRNADGMALALEARGFSAAGSARPRDRVRGAGGLLTYRFGWRDAVAALSLLALLLCVAWLRSTGLGRV
jgi:energy-coupling factor transport system permease protein